MELNSLSDVKLAGRALAAGWLNGHEEKRKRAVEAMLEVVVSGSDQKMKIEAFEALVRADQADLKREEVSIRKQEADDNKRLRYLEILQHLPPGEISKLTSGNAEDVEAG